MRTLKKALLGVALSASALTAAAPAEAQRYGGGYYGGYHGGDYGYRRYRGGDGAALAVGAGILGLAVGAAIASNHNDRYYDRGYRRYYYQAPVYSENYYYYDEPRYSEYRSCWSERVWDGYRGGWARVQRCR